MIAIALVTVFFQGCCSDCQKQLRINKELGEMAYSSLDYSEMDELLNKLIKKAIKGSDCDIDKYIYVRTLIHDDGYYGFEDRDVELLKGLGDVRFLESLKRQDRELQDDVCGNLMRYQWNIDADDEAYDAAKARPEYEYPKTKEYVFELSKSWYKD
jgi:hypothetical protein